MRSVFFGALILCTMGLVHTPKTSVKHTISIDPILAEQAQQNLVHKMTYLSGSAHEIAQHVHDPAVEKITCQIDHQGTRHIHIRGITPCLRINTDAVMTTHGHIINMSYFAPHALDHCPQVIVPHMQTLDTKQLLSCAQQLLPEVVEQFTITWKHANEIVLQHKQQPSFSIVTDIVHMPHEKQIQLCVKAYEHIKEKIKTPIADIRFKNQIVMYGEKGIS